MRLLVLLSGGIDSPVAAYMMANVGAEVLVLHMDNQPYSDSLARARRLVERLRAITGQDMPMHGCPHGRINLAALESVRDRHIRCVLCKRFMLRVAEALATGEGCGAIVTGDSLGQVASQTLRNMRVEQEAVDIPILRPLIGLDKLEIIETAKRIRTFEISTDTAGACAFAPAKPSTGVSLERVRRTEDLLDIEGLVQACLSEVRRL